MKTKQEIKNLLRRVRFNSQNDVDAVKRFLDGIGIEVGQTDENMFQRDLTTARFFITCVTQQVFSEQVPMDIVVDLGIQIYNLCVGTIKSHLSIVTSEESGIVMVGKDMGMYRNGVIDVCYLPGTVTTLIGKKYRNAKFALGDRVEGMKEGRCYQVVIPRAEEHDTEIIAPGKHYMLYVGDNYWTLNSNLYYNVTDIPGVDIRVLEEVG